MVPPRRPPSPYLTVQCSAPLAPREAFEKVTTRLIDGLRRVGVALEPTAGGRLEADGQEFGRVTKWTAGTELRAIATPVTWEKASPVTLMLRVTAERDGSLVTLKVGNWKQLTDRSNDGPLDWFGGTLLPAVLREMTPAAVGDWWTDRKARRPTGEAAARTYRDPTYHWPNFLSILDRIRLGPGDRLLEVACGGGAFLSRALESGCTAVAIDHSPDMLRVARETNRTAIESGRLRVEAGEADRLPVPDAAFTCCVCTGAIGFFPDPRAALLEMYRALAPEGRLVVYSSPPGLRGTLAAPEPIASRVRFYEPKELAALARSAGFSEIRVVPAEESKYARKAGLPSDVLAVFDQLPGANLLLARRPGTDGRPSGRVGSRRNPSPARAERGPGENLARGRQ